MNQKIIILTQDKAAIVDSINHEWLDQWNWYAHHVRRTDKWYARRNSNFDGARRPILMHRAIFEHLGVDIDGFDIDHINGNGLDNRLENLRLVTRAENAYNRRKSPGRTSQYKGVYFDSDRGKWRASIKVNGRTIQLGRYETEEEAAIAYRIAARKYHQIKVR
ncbi:MAG: AP2 domain protein [Methanosaeta sp. PtaU1.Bin028]|nr:MAG: AP2 domain protein [Methanosaeta sp. PtaU1.Bin028]